MRIVATQDFIENTDRFTAGVTYDVDDALAAYFTRQGWATHEGAAQIAALPQNVSLSIQNGGHTQRSRWEKFVDGVIGRG